MFEVARRNPYFYAPELLCYTQQYKGVLTECCKAADRAACLGPKMDDLQRKLQVSAYREKFKCSTLQKSGESALQKWFVVLLTQKFGGASFETVSTLATDFTKVHKECCHGDLLECADDRFDELKRLVDEPQELVKKCKVYEQLGEYGFQNVALAELLKHKPKATEEQLKTVVGDFTTFLQKCCSAADKEACFAEEGPKLVASSQAVFA
uniref:Albumin n=1 Tax=Molossus molossus TaxID=27622 RepID=A0A7J8JV98_MOLMO|nr:hypothetical protein HJG59_007831 [Molossus molossus]